MLNKIGFNNTSRCPAGLLTPEQALEMELKMKEQQKQQNIKYHSINSNLPNNFRLRSLSNITILNKEQEKVKKALMTWDPQKKASLPFIYGPPGTGKSYLAKAFINTAINKTGLSAKYLFLPLFLLQKATTYNANEIYNEIRPFLDSYVLVIDDLGANSITKHTLNIVHVLLETRLSRNKPTLITSNLSIAKISSSFSSAKEVNLEECVAIQDRIIELCYPIKLGGQSIRIKNALARKKVN